MSLPSLSDLRVPYELRLGVTGHRELADPAAVADAVTRLLDEIDRTLAPQDRVPLEWTIVSPLAKGADRIVARAVLSRPKSRLEVITPFSLQEYRKDFKEEEDRREFEELLRRKASVVELNKGATSPRDRARQHTGYQDVGHAVAQACEILIAIWDGRPLDGRGGTGEIVEYAVDRGQMVLWISAQDPGADVKMIRPARLGVRSSGISHRTAAPPTTAKALSPGYHQLSAFLRDTAAATDDDRQVLEQKTDELRAHARTAKLPDDHLPPILRHVLPYFVRVGSLARMYQRRHVLASKAIYFLSATAVSIVVFQVLFFPHVHWLVIFEVFAMLAALASLVVNRRQAWHEKWIHDRYFAEHMRTATYSLVLGDPTPRMAHAPTALPFYVGPKRWLPATVRQIIAEARRDWRAPTTPDDVELEACKRYVVDGWLLEQQAWHVGNAVRKERLHRLTRRTVVALFVLTLAMAILHVLGIGRVDHGSAVGSPGNWFTFLAITLPAWATAVHAIGKQLEYERIAARSAQMADVLDQFVTQAEQAGTITELGKIVLDATHVIGLENYEWSVLLSFDPPELAV